MKFSEFFYPEYCVHCKRDLSEGWDIQRSRIRRRGKEAPFLQFLCLDCFLTLRPQPLSCPICGKSRPEGTPCARRCRKQSHLDRLISWTSYDRPVLRSALRALKYWGVQPLAQSLAEGLIRRLEEEGWAEQALSKQVLITFVPVASWRRKTRGFDQAQVLAEVLAQTFGLPLAPCLRRPGMAVSQVSFRGQRATAWQARQANVKGAFEIVPSLQSSLKKKKLVWLVDDVYTSGATLQEAAYQLKQAGAREIWGLTLARASS